MAGVRWERPSVVVVFAAVTIVTVFAVRGDLRVESGASRARGSGAVTSQEEARASRSVQPLVVRPERAARREQATVPVRGRVFDAMGFLLVGAEVQGLDRSWVRTDADGVFRAEVPANGVADLAVRASGHRPARVRASAVSPDALLVQMVPAAPWDAEPAATMPAPAQLTGEGIVRGVDGKPVAGAFVTVQGSGVWSRTDEIGRYVLPLPSTAATLVVHQPEASADGRGLAARSEPFVAGRERGVVPLPELVAEAAATIRGTLRDERGSPLVGVPVQVRGEGFSRVLESGVSGVFRLAGLLPGTYEVRPFAFRGALGRRQQVVLDRPAVDCELQLSSAAERRLRVLDDRGAPVPLAYVATAVDGDRSSVTQADAQGWAAVRGCTEGAQFEVRAADGLQAMPVQRFEAEAGTLVVALP